MYPEFVAIYIGLGVLFVMLAVVIVLLIVIQKKLKQDSASKSTSYQNYSTVNQFTSADYAKRSSGIVTCRNCGTQFDGATNICPRCGTPR